MNHQIGDKIRKIREIKGGLLRRLYGVAVGRLSKGLQQDGARRD